MKCMQHSTVDAVGTCQSCGAGVCADCAHRSNPMTCNRCLIQQYKVTMRSILRDALFACLAGVAFIVLFGRGIVQGHTWQLVLASPVFMYMGAALYFGMKDFHNRFVGGGTNYVVVGENNASVAGALVFMWTIGWFYAIFVGMFLALWNMIVLPRRYRACKRAIAAMA